MAAPVPGRYEIHFSPTCRGGVVEEGVDEDLLDAALLEPQPPGGRLVAAVDAVRGVGVVAPVDHQLGVSQRVLEQVVVLRVAEPPPEAVGVGRAPVPAFPAVRVVQDVGEPDEVEEPRPGRGPVAEVAPVVVRRGPGRDRLGPVLGADALHLAGDQLERLVPADPLVAGLAAVLRVALPVGVEVDPLHRVEDALVRVDPSPLGQREGRDAGLARRACTPHPRPPASTTPRRRRRTRAAARARSCRPPRARGSARRSCSSQSSVPPSSVPLLEGPVSRARADAPIGYAVGAPFRKAISVVAKPCRNV